MSTSASLPVIITQDEDFTTPPTMAKSSNVNSNRTPNLFPAGITPRRSIQVDLWGKPVPPSKLKVKVKSYKKRNGTSVSKYSRDRKEMVTLKAPKPRISFKELFKSGDSCTDSINLAHSIYFDEMRSVIQSVGKTAAHLIGK